jgi:hypothetical protein
MGFMTSFRHLASLAKKTLRYFKYAPPVGGFGGDFDELYAEALIADDVERERALEVLGCQGLESTMDANMPPVNRSIADVNVTISIVIRGNWPGAVPEQRIRLTVGVYVTESQISDAQQLEAWLDDKKLIMVRS